MMKVIKIAIFALTVGLFAICADSSDSGGVVEEISTDGCLTSIEGDLYSSDCTFGSGGGAYFIGPGPGYYYWLRYMAWLRQSVEDAGCVEHVPPNGLPGTIGEHGMTVYDCNCIAEKFGTNSPQYETFCKFKTDIGLLGNF
ncbi:MAG: hypothetical protein HY606_11815 [Planctomycetes bacterium]|nr:hypothetical protein [Planctomycetota bacterium]